jgi:phosphatidate cytidylyltransferase
MVGDPFPEAWWPIALRLAAVFAGGAVLVVAADLITGRRRASECGGTDAGARSSLWSRFGVSAAIAAVLLAAVGWGAGAFGLAMAVAVAQAVRELARAVRRTVPFRTAVLALAGGAIAAATGFWSVTGGLAAALGAIVTLRLAGLPRGREREVLRAMALDAAVVFYIAAPIAALVALRHAPNGFGLVVWTIVVVGLADVAAMFGGLLAGRTPVFTRISPAKTAEGLAAGFLGAIGGAALVRLSLPDVPTLAYYGATLAVAAAGIAGDLAASAVKRRVGIKDFGAALPGHGGVMDRLDSLILAAPVAVVCALTLLAAGNKPA